MDKRDLQRYIETEIEHEAKNKQKTLNFTDFDIDNVLKVRIRNFVYILLGLLLFAYINYRLPFSTTDIYKIPTAIAPTTQQDVIKPSSTRNPSQFRFDKQGLTLPDLSAAEIYVFDPNSQQVFFKKNENSPQPVASLVKLMTAMVILDNYKLTDRITFNGDFSGLSTSIGIQDGDSMEVQDVLKGMLINSDNDLAEGVTVNFPGGGDRFFEKVKEKSDQIGLVNSRFETGSGLYDDKDSSSAQDLYKIAQVALTYSKIKEIVKMPTATVTITRKDGTEDKIDINTTNQLLWTNGNARGLKTGYTQGAGQCYIGYFVNANGQEVVSIVLGSEDRFGETTVLMNSL